MSVNKTPRGLEKGVKGVGSKDQKNVCMERRGKNIRQMAVEIIDANTKENDKKKNARLQKAVIIHSSINEFWVFCHLSSSIVTLACSTDASFPGVKSHLETKKAFIPKNNIQLASALCPCGKQNESQLKTNVAALQIISQR